jgi:ATP-dependent phosphofructokinase / diphosphate-dependent phosphofructokinase
MKTSGAGLVAHSGGPTAVINASLLGVVEQARKRGFGGLYGARFGIQGILREEFVDLLAQPEATMRAVSEAPASALGTSRLEVGEAELERALGVMRAREIRYFFYTGGNGSMGTASQMERMARAMGYELSVVGIPKTIDNDLTVTDHTPGYATTARFFAAAARDIGADNRALPGQVEFVEVLGRNTGWLVAATLLARNEPDDAPHLIYLPEWPLPLEELLADVERVFRRLGRCVVAVCEGQLDENGEPFGADVRAGSRGSLASNLAHRLSILVQERLKIRARAEKPGLLGRASCAERPLIDWVEAKECGAAAVRAACAGVSGQMITLVRRQAPAYESTTGLAPLEQVAFVERGFPTEWRSASGNDISPAFLDYIVPLTGALPSYARLI